MATPAIPIASRKEIAIRRRQTCGGLAITYEHPASRPQGLCAYGFKKFDSGSDLESLSLTFVPDGSIAYYEACREKINEFPTDPNGETYVPLGDDDFAEVVLNDGREILFYGQWYDRFYIGSNGYITFGAGDTESVPSLESHFSMPRISALFTDLTPATSQNISYKQLDDRVVVTFQNVPLYGNKTAINSFQVEMFFVDGTICISWLDIAATEAVAGLSKGAGLPALFTESDLSDYPPCWPFGDFNRDYSVDMFDLAIFVSHWLEADCGIPLWCEKTDLDFSSMVDITDVGIFAENWLAKEDWWLQPISHWKFDEGTGDIAYDSAGQNHETIYGATWTTGQIDGALSFDGINDYVEVSDSTTLDITDKLTVCAWVKRDVTGVRHNIVAKHTKTSPYNGFHLVIGPADNVGFAATIGNSWQQCAGGEVVDTSWHHLAGTFDGTEMRLYIDGNLIANNIVSGKLAVNDNKLYAGRAEPTFGDYFFNGTIDDVHIYGRALSAEEIWQLYQQGLSEKASKPYPADGAANVDPNVILRWSPGKNALSHDVYLGLDYNDVNNATPDSNEYMGNFDVNSYDPNGLALETTYYWRIDERNASGTAKGDVWCFRSFCYIL